MPPPNLDDLAKRYLAGEPAQKLGKELGVKGDTVARWLRQRGVQIRGRSEAGKLARANLPGFTAVVRSYLGGESVNSIARRLGINRRSVEMRLREAGVVLRTQSQAEAAKWRRMSPAKRLLQVAAAHSSRVGKDERQLVEYLRRAGCPATPQRYVEPYYIDVALDELPVAIEVESGASFTVRERVERLKHLLDQNWFVVYVTTRTGFDVFAAGDKLIALLELARRDKSVFGKYGVIDGHGKPAAARHRNIKHLPRVVNL